MAGELIKRKKSTEKHYGNTGLYIGIIIALALIAGFAIQFMSSAKTVTDASLLQPISGSGGDDKIPPVSPTPSPTNDKGQENANLQYLCIRAKDETGRECAEYKWIDPKTTSYIIIDSSQPKIVTPYQGKNRLKDIWTRAELNRYNLKTMPTSQKEIYDRATTIYDDGNLVVKVLIIEASGGVYFGSTGSGLTNEKVVITQLDLAPELADVYPNGISFQYNTGNLKPDRITAGGSMTNAQTINKIRVSVQYT